MRPMIIKYMSHKVKYNSESKKFFIRFCTNEFEKGIELLCFIVDKIEDLSKCQIYEARVKSEEESGINVELYDKANNIVDSVTITEDLIIESSKEFKCLVERDKMYNSELKEVVSESYNYVVKYDRDTNMISFYKTMMN